MAAMASKLMLLVSESNELQKPTLVCADAARGKRGYALGFEYGGEEIHDFAAAVRDGQNRAPIEGVIRAEVFGTQQVLEDRRLLGKHPAEYAEYLRPGVNYQISIGIPEPVDALQSHEGNGVLINVQRDSCPQEVEGLLLVT